MKKNKQQIRRGIQTPSMQQISPVNEAVISSLANALFGETGVKNPSSLLALSSRKTNTLFSNVEDMAKAIENEFSKKSEVKTVYLDTMSNNISKINNTLIDLKATMIDSSENIINSLQYIEENFETALDFFNNFKPKENTDKDNLILAAIIEQGVISALSKKSLFDPQELAEKISKKIDIDFEFKNTENITRFLNELINMSTSENIPDNDVLRFLLDITDPGDGIINKVLDNLETLNGRVDINIPKITNLNGFFKSFIELGEITSVDRMLMMKNIKFINKYLSKDIMDIIDDISNLAEVTDKQRLSLKAATDFFDMISKIVDIKIESKTKLYKDMIYIKTIIQEDINDIIGDIISVGSDAEKTVPILKEINGLFDNIINIVNIDERKSENVLNNIDILNDLFNFGISELFDSINRLKDKDKIALEISKLTSISMQISEGIIENLPSTNKSLNAAIKLNLLSIAINKFIDIHKKLSETKINDIKAISYLNQMQVLLDYILHDKQGIIISFKKLGNVDYKHIFKTAKNVNKMFSEFFDMTENISKNSEKIINGNLVESIDKMNKVFEKLYVLNPTLSKNQIDSLHEYIHIIRSFNKMMFVASITAPFSSVAVFGLKMIAKSVDSLKVIIDGISKINNKDVAQFNDLLKNLNSFMIKASAVMLIGASVASIINFKDLMIFNTSLIMFVAGIGFTIAGISKIINRKALRSINKLNSYVIGAGAIMLGAGFIANLIDFKGLILFTGTLASFVTALSIPIGLMAIMNRKGGGNAAVAIGKFNALIVSSGAVLLAAGLLSHIIDTNGLMMFAATLGTFIIGTTAPLMLMSRFIRKSMKSMKDLTLLVVASGGVLLGASLVADKINYESLLMFTGTLAGFIGAITISYGIAGMLARSSMRSAKDFSKLVVMSGAILLGGALVMDILDSKKLILFTGTLAGFIATITLSYGLASRGIRRSLNTAYALSVLTAVSAAAMLIGGKMLYDNPGMDKSTILFASTLSAYTGIMGGIAFLLGKFSGPIKRGELYMTGIVGITYLSTLALREVYNLMDNENAFKRIMSGVGTMSAAMAIVLTMASGIGALAMSGIGAAIMGAGLGLMGAISGIIYLSASAMKNVAESMDEMNKVKNFDANAVKRNISGFLSIINELKPLTKNIGTILKISLASTLLGKAIGSISSGIKDYANLSIPIYEGDKIVGRKKLSESDFANAGTNIGNIVSILGKTLSKTYNDNPEFFDYGLFTVSPVKKITNAASKMGAMISTLARAVSQYANLNVAVKWNDNGDPIEFMQLGKSDFENAAKSVNTIITVVGKELINTYNANPELFEVKRRGRKTPFQIVTNSCATMGSMIGDIAKGVKDMADLKIPIYDADGNVTGYRTLNENDFKNASNNISKIITTIGNALLKTFGEHKDWFTLPPLKTVKNGFLGMNKKVIETANNGASPFERVIVGCAKMGTLITSVADAIVKVSDLRIPILDENGNPTNKMRKMVAADFSKAESNIVKILTVLGNAINNTVINNPKLFNVKTNNEINKAAVESIVSISGILGNVAKEILPYSNEQIPIEFDKDGKPTKYAKVDFDKASKNITNMFDSIINIITSIEKKHNESRSRISKLFSSSSGIDAEKTVKPIAQLMETIGSLGKSYIETIDLAESIKKENAENLAESINILSKSSTSIGDQENFERHVNSLDKYVKAVQNIDVNKVSKLKDLSETLMRLSEKLGSMDNLAEVLSNKLTAALEGIAEKLEGSTAALTRSDNLQEERRKAINKSIADIKEIMDQSLKVEVYQGAESSTASTGLSGGVGNAAYDDGSIDDERSIPNMEGSSNATDYVTGASSSSKPAYTGSSNEMSMITMENAFGNALRKFFKNKGTTYTLKV